MTRCWLASWSRILRCRCRRKLPSGLQAPGRYRTPFGVALLCTLSHSSTLLLLNKQIILLSYFLSHIPSIWEEEEGQNVPWLWVAVLDNNSTTSNPINDGIFDDQITKHDPWFEKSEKETRKTCVVGVCSMAAGTILSQRTLPRASSSPFYYYDNNFSTTMKIPLDFPILVSLSLPILLSFFFAPTRRRLVVCKRESQQSIYYGFRCIRVKWWIH